MLIGFPTGRLYAWARVIRRQPAGSPDPYQANLQVAWQFGNFVA